MNINQCCRSDERKEYKCLCSEVVADCKIYYFQGISDEKKWSECWHREPYFREFATVSIRMELQCSNVKKRE